MKHRKTISPKPIHHGLEIRRGEILRTEAAGVQFQTVSGKVLVSGSGQARFDVSFPVTFTEQPALSFGASVDDNRGHGASNGDTSFPTVSVVLLDWTRYERLSGTFFYRGAHLTAVMDGSPGYTWVHWQASGKAFVNPAFDLGSTQGAT